MRPRPRAIAVLLVLLLTLGGCSGDHAPVVATPTSYLNEVDGVSATWPVGWHRALEELSGGKSGHIELLALTTFEDPKAGQCSPHPDAAMTAMKGGDAMLVLRTDAGPIHDQPPRPKDLMAGARRRPAGQPPVQPSCFPPGVDARLASFQEHGRHYEAFVAVRAPLSEHLRREIQQIWSQLKIRPIETGLENADLGRPYWHNLYTHCGIKGTKFDGREWVADPEISDGQGNMPREWADLEIGGGTITLTEQDAAVYEDRGGKHAATFRPRTAQDEPAGPCL